MRFLLSATAAIALFAGFILAVLAQSAIHEIEAACASIIFAIAGSGAAILDSLDKARQESVAAKILLEQIARQTKGNEAPVQNESSLKYITDEPNTISVGWIAIALCGLVAILMLVALSQKK